MTREEAIGRIQEHIRIHSKKEPFTPYLDEAFDMAIDALKEERPHGEWIPSAPKGLVQVWYQRYKCSLCKKFGWIDWNFCPNCGAQMLEEPKTDEKEGEAE